MKVPYGTLVMAGRAHARHPGPPHALWARRQAGQESIARYPAQISVYGDGDTPDLALDCAVAPPAPRSRLCTLARPSTATTSRTGSSPNRSHAVPCTRTPAGEHHNKESRPHNHNHASIGFTTRADSPRRHAPSALAHTPLSSFHIRAMRARLHHLAAHWLLCHVGLYEFGYWC